MPGKTPVKKPVTNSKGSGPIRAVDPPMQAQAKPGVPKAAPVKALPAKASAMAKARAFGVRGVAKRKARP